MHAQPTIREGRVRRDELDALATHLTQAEDAASLIPALMVAGASGAVSGLKPGHAELMGALGIQTEQQLAGETVHAQKSNLMPCAKGRESE